MGCDASTTDFNEQNRKARATDTRVSGSTNIQNSTQQVRVINANTSTNRTSPPHVSRNTSEEERNKRKKRENERMPSLSQFSYAYGYNYDYGSCHCHNSCDCGPSHCGGFDGGGHCGGFDGGGCDCGG